MYANIYYIKSLPKLSMINSICKKGTQALNYFICRKNGSINKMKAIKLVYLADRYHLRKYGRPIVGDFYWAMKYGPVGSTTLDIADLESKKLNTDSLKYVKGFLIHPKGDIKKKNLQSRQEVDLDVFSQTDVEALEAVFKEFADKDQFELAELTHEYPEWSKHKDGIVSKGNKRAQMDYMDFFLNPRNKKSDFFQIDEKHLLLSKSIFQENQEAEAFLN